MTMALRPPTLDMDQHEQLRELDFTVMEAKVPSLHGILASLEIVISVMLNRGFWSDLEKPDCRAYIKGANHFSDLETVEAIIIDEHGKPNGVERIIGIYVTEQIDFNPLHVALIRKDPTALVDAKMNI